MMKTHSRTPNWPTEAQELLLKAAFFTGPPALSAWEKWVDLININEVDFGSQCILPLVMTNLRAQGVTHPVLGKFKGVYRQNWVRNQILFNEAADVIRALNQQGIDSIVLKGGALATRYYQDVGLRYMGDFDLLVRPQHIFQAIEEINKLSWVLRESMHDLTETNIRYRKEVHYVSPSGKPLDLHRCLLFANPDPGADQEFWASAVPMQIKDVSSLALSPPDQLFHCCVHGLNWLEVPSLRWIADALLLLRSEPDMDWDRIVDQAERWQVVLAMRQTLHYLAHRMDAPIPGTVLSRLDRLPISRHDRMAYRAHNLPHNRLTTFNQRIVTYSRFYAQGSGFLRRVWGFPRFLQHSWRLKSLIQVPFKAAGKGGQRVVKFLSGDLQ